ncbi:hypothetical protein Tco_1065432 [Tanacetum coccineum]
MIGSLMYLTSSRPDIMFAVCVCARFQVNPKVSHLHAVKRIFKYLKGQHKLSLWYPNDSPFDLVAYTDSDYAGASLDRKSITGVKNPVFHSKTKHIKIRHHFIRDSNEKKLIQIIKIHTDKNVADLLTKAFDDTVEVKSINREVQLQALVDKNEVIITESTIRRDLQLEDAEGTDFLPNATIFEQLALIRIYVTPSHTKKIFENIKREEKGFSGRVTPLFPTMMVQAHEEMGEGLANPIDPYHTPIITQPSTSKTQKKQKLRKPKRKDTKIPQSSGPIEPIADEAVNKENIPTYFNDLLLNGDDSLKLNDLMKICIKLQQRVLDLENTKTTQAQEISSLKLRVKRLEKKGGSRTYKLKRLFKIGRSAQVVYSKDEGLGDQEDASKQRRKIDDIDQDAEVTLVDETQGRYDDAQMFDTDVFNGEEVFVTEQSEKVVEEVVSSVEVSVATTTTTTVITKVDLTLAQALAELRSAKPKVVVQEPVQSPTITAPSTIPTTKSITFRDPAEEEEQARLAREKVEKVEEANISWDNVQEMIQADRLLAERLQVREQEELTNKEKAILFVELLEKRKKHFAALRA